MNTSFKKILASIIIVILLLSQNVSIVGALDTPEAPAVPTTPEVPTAPTAPSSPEVPTAPTHPTEPTATPAPEESPTPTPTRKPKPTTTPEAPTTESAAASPTVTPTSTPSPTSDQSSGNEGQTQSGQTGDTEINTGDATNDAAIITSGNTNSAAVPNGSGDSIGISNTGNGSQSNNDSSAQISDTSTTVQDNSAIVNNDLAQNTTTGKNNADNNVGSSEITTGDANTSGTIITAVNTNVDGVMISEFNVNDDHTGDIVLDFSAGCLTGCGSTNTEIANQHNGSGSTNDAGIDTRSNTASFQNNDATIGNNLVLDSNSGDNSTSGNTGGDSTIKTGDANVSANVLTFANNNIAGNVIYGVVNIYGDLVGDILFPEEMLTKNCCGTGSTTVQNIGNGSGSDNTASIHTSDTDSTFQYNDATIENVLTLDTQTGNNTAGGNTGGNTKIETGNTTIDANVLNVANNNVNGGNWWLVLVNEAGNWIGRIIGGEAGSNTMAGSVGTEFSVTPSGEITATNTGNGTGTSNTANISNNTSDTTVQTNTANIVNTLDLSANSGGNDASNNTGGDSTIKTGDANIIANMVNFVNNNIVGNGKLVVTVVNVFGSWLGDFVTPGAKKATPAVVANQENTPAIGGTNVQLASVNTPESDTKVSTDDSAVATYAVTTPTPTQKTTRTNRGVQAGVTTAKSTATEGDVAAFTTDDTTSTAIVTPEPAVAGKKVVHINLAWLILTIPCGILLVAVRFAYMRIKQRLLSTAS